MDVNVITPTTLEEARSSLAEAFERKHWVTIAALCKAWYEGRGASEATLGDRIIMVKPDGSVVVHGHKGFKPLNWQPDTSSITVLLEDNILTIKAYRRTPREILVLECINVYAMIIASNPEEGQFWMYMSEEDIRDAILENLSLVEDGLTVIDIEKPIEPGFVDLYARDKNGNVVVVEIKRVKAGEGAAKQLLSYVEILKSRGIKARGILVAPSATEGALRLLHLHNLEFKPIELRKLYMSTRRKIKTRQLTDYIR